MSFPKILAITTVVLFSIIGLLAAFKGDKNETSKQVTTLTPLATPIAVELKKEVPVVVKAKPSTPVVVQQPAPTPVKPLIAQTESEPVNKTLSTEKSPMPSVDRIHEVFNKGLPKFPFVETIVYKSRVPWQKGRPAWLSDYASHYTTSRHFIARSLNGKPDYFKQDISEGDRFNVLRKDMNLQFHLLVDISRCKLMLYCIDQDNNQRWLIKTYDVGLGRPDPTKASAYLTPTGKYTLGNKIAIYKPKMQGIHNGAKVEMIRIFGTRWIPFDKEIVDCTAPAKGFGVHGVPWTLNVKNELAQDKSSLGKYEGDGCVRLSTEDVEEIFSIVITKPTVIELVKDYHDAVIPGVEQS